MIVVGVGVLIAWTVNAVWALITGSHPTIIQAISLAVTLIGGLLTLIAEFFWKWIWQRFPRLQEKTFPDVSGSWKGTLLSTWISPSTGQPSPPIEIEITINQGLFFTTISLKANESTSHSTRVFLEPFYEGRRFRIWYSYANEPRAQFQYRSAPHEGVAFLELDFNDDPNRLRGSYYTSRKTTGDIDLVRR